MESMQCISQEKVCQDKRLNDLYQELLRMLDGKMRAQLINAQYAWLNSRSKDESLEAMLYGGGR
ncbi:lysozyme inhibitor LprI family protein [Marilutibacter chinensis]|uniref:lysozyme inhibitor LprI family protein n=1 Tax=Marilutibacter chinensis TaxID=2912247 RepID=UPI003CCE017E